MSTNPNPTPQNPKQTARPDGRGDANPDPLTGAPGSHPVGTGVGATAGGAAGLGIGAAVAGPVGAVVGAAAGAVAGGVGGKKVAERLDPTVEESYWRERYRSRPYVGADEPFDLYLPAYRFGWEHRDRASDRVAGTFDEVESDLSRAWGSIKHTTSLTWDKARGAVRDAWDRVSLERAEGEGMRSPKSRGPSTGATSDPKPSRN